MDSSLGVAGVGRTAMRRMQGKWQERGGVKREESGRMRIHVGGGDCVVWNERDMICPCKCMEMGDFFAMMYMGSHMQGKTVHGKC